MQNTQHKLKKMEHYQVITDFEALDGKRWPVYGPTIIAKNIKLAVMICEVTATPIADIFVKYGEITCMKVNGHQIFDPRWN